MLISLPDIEDHAIQLFGQMVGESILHYRILARLGSGGMGEVYEAEDTKLGRRIALKILPATLAGRPEALERFKREARALAALNHPGIVTIYSVEESGGRQFLTMERVEGRPLAEVIPKGGLPIEKFFDCAISLADALAAAHAKGIGHRDLKPSNVMVTASGHVKVIDFGIAKLLDADSDSADPEANTRVAATIEGQILGTPAYMSPEQVQGQAVDHRSDIFSLGILLSEMATGQRPFQGQNPATIMSAILKDSPPPISALKPDLPEHLGRIVRRCLQKLPAERYQSSLDVRNELAGLRQETKETKALVAQRPSSRTRPLGLAAAVVIVLIILAALVHRSQSKRRLISVNAQTNSLPAKTTPLLLRLEASRQITYEQGLEDWPSWAPDGQRFVYSAEAGGFKNLFVRSLESGQSTRLTQTNRDDVMPAWNPANPDEIVFVRHQDPGGKLETSDVYGGYFLSGGDLWKRNLKTGQEKFLLEDVYAPSFAAGGQIAFHRHQSDEIGVRIWTCDAEGHHVTIQTRDDSTATFHLEPSFKRDGSMVVYRREEKNLSSLWVLNLKTREQSALTKPGLYVQPCWSPSGRFVYFSSYLGRSGMNIWRVAVTSDGKAASPPEPVTSGQGADLHPAISPNGGRMLFSISRSNSDIWKLPVDKLTGSSNGPPEVVIATSREDSRGAWSPDESWIAFNSDRDNGNMNLWLHPMQGGGPDAQITTGPGGDYQPDFSPDGKSLVFFSLRSGNADVWLAKINNGKPDGEPRPLTSDPAMDMNPFFSPDGRKIAFMSDRNGRTELFVMNSDGSDQRSLNQPIGGHFLRWHGDAVAKEIVREEKLSMARVKLDGTLETLAEFPHRGMGAHYSFSPDLSSFMELRNHTTIVVASLRPPLVNDVFQLSGSDEHIDYPVWAPSGRWVLFDRMVSQGGDVFLVDNLE